MNCFTANPDTISDRNPDMHRSRSRHTGTHLGDGGTTRRMGRLNWQASLSRGGGGWLDKGPKRICRGCCRQRRQCSQVKPIPSYTVGERQQRFREDDGDWTFRWTVSSVDTGTRYQRGALTAGGRAASTTANQVPRRENTRPGRLWDTVYDLISCTAPTPYALRRGTDLATITTADRDAQQDHSEQRKAQARGGVEPLDICAKS